MAQWFDALPPLPTRGQRPEIPQSCGGRGEANGAVIKRLVIHYRGAASQKTWRKHRRRSPSLLFPAPPLAGDSLFPAWRRKKKDGRRVTRVQLSPPEIKNYGSLHKHKAMLRRLAAEPLLGSSKFPACSRITEKSPLE